MLTGGLITFGVSYVPWLLVDIVATIAVVQLLGGVGVLGGLILAIPVLGPAMTGGLSLSQGDVPTGGLLMIDALVQGVGIGLIAMAYGSPERYVRQPAAPPAPTTSWMILPGVQGVNGPASGARLALAF